MPEKPVCQVDACVLLGCFRVTLAGRWCAASVSVCFCSVWWAGERDVPDTSVLEFMLKSATTAAGSWRKAACRRSAENKSSPARTWTNRVVFELISVQLLINMSIILTFHSIAKRYNSSSKDFVWKIFIKVLLCIGIEMYSPFYFCSCFYIVV